MLAKKSKRRENYQIKASDIIAGFFCGKLILGNF